MKRIKSLLLFTILIGLFCMISGCTTITSNDDVSSQQQDESDAVLEEDYSAKPPLSKNEFEQMFSDPKKFKGRAVDFYAKIFIEPEKDTNNTVLQVYANNDNSKNTIVWVNENINLKNGDIIHIIGTVKDKFEGENAFGGKVIAPLILATKIELSDYATAFAPSLKTVELNSEQSQHGLIIKIGKIEFAEDETRIYVKIVNNTKWNASFYSFNVKMTQGNKQHETIYNYDEELPEIKSEILPGITEEGIILMEPVDINGENIKIILEASSDNWELNYSPYTFDVRLK